MELTNQGYYNLIVYESDTKDMKHLFERTGEHSDEEVNQWIDEALSFLSDRLHDGSYDSDEDSDMPSKDELHEKMDVLAEMKSQTEY